VRAMLELRPPRLGSASDRAALDLRSQFLFADGAADDSGDVLTAGIAWHMTHVHECGHWIRVHGSTIGLALTMLRAARDITAFNTLQGLNSDRKRELSQRRGSGERLFSFTAKELSDPELRTWSTIWLDLYFTYHALFDSTAIEALHWDNRSAISGGIADSWLHLAEFGHCLPYPGNEAARSSVIGDVVFGSAGGRPLTTRLLLECAGVVDELAQLNPDLIDRTAGLDVVLLTAINETDYGVPWRAASTIAGRVLNASTVLSLIDFALNPPLPFLDSRYPEVTWLDLYPPSRFALAARVLRSGGGLSDFPDPEEALAFRGWLEKASKLPYGAVDVDLSGSSSLAESLDAPNADWIGAMLYVSQRLLPVRFEDPCLISHFGQAFRGGEATRMIEADSWNDAVFPFIQVVDGRFFSRPSVSRQQASTFLFSVAASAAIDDVVNGVGPLTEDHLPDSFVAERREWLHEQASSALGIKL